MGEKTGPVPGGPQLPAGDARKMNPALPPATLDSRHRDAAEGAVSGARPLLPRPMRGHHSVCLLAMGYGPESASSAG